MKNVALWILVITSSLAFAMPVSAEPTFDTEPAAEEAQSTGQTETEDDDDVRCTSEPQTGSRIPLRTCTTARERAELREDALSFLRTLHDFEESRIRAR